MNNVELLLWRRKVYFPFVSLKELKSSYVRSPPPTHFTCFQCPILTIRPRQPHRGKWSRKGKANHKQCSYQEVVPKANSSKWVQTLLFSPYVNKPEIPCKRWCDCLDFLDCGSDCVCSHISSPGPPTLSLLIQILCLSRKRLISYCLLGADYKGSWEPRVNTRNWCWPTIKFRMNGKRQTLQGTIILMLYVKN